MLQIFLILFIIFILVSIVPFCQYIFSKKEITSVEYIFDKELFDIHLGSNNFFKDASLNEKIIFDRKELEKIKQEEYLKELP